uniref:Uncharacterized protein n=1 Tax=Cyanoptyche gloeocystis TaxID=77922 RepID=A0A7S2NMU0_9EUKA|mmetsp:Transcript_1404/g.2653  ORF Transcript_1404/g.2653 Transcript_1404/m.2653 type:complete len:107 (+) Transcript_1404:400-720(+)
MTVCVCFVGLRDGQYRHGTCEGMQRLDSLHLCELPDQVSVAQGKPSKFHSRKKMGFRLAVGRMGCQPAVVQQDKLGKVSLLCFRAARQQSDKYARTKSGASDDTSS